MSTDYRCKVILLFYLSCFYPKIDSQFTESPEQSLVACSGNTLNLRWNYITPNMITLQWYSGSLEMLSQVQTNPPTYSNNFNESVVEFVSDAEILLKALATSSTGSYSCRVSYLSGDDYSNATYLTVYDTFTNGLSCQYNGEDITCTKPDASVSLNATDGQGQGVELINPTASGNYTICMQGDAIVCRGAFPTCTTVEVIIQESTTTVYPDTSFFSSFGTSSSLESTPTNVLENITNPNTNTSKYLKIMSALVALFVVCLFIFAIISTKKNLKKKKTRGIQSKISKSTDDIRLSDTNLNTRYVDVKL